MMTRRLYLFLDRIGGRKIYMGIFSMLLVTIAYFVKSFQIEDDNIAKTLFDSYGNTIIILFFGSIAGNVAGKFIDSKTSLLQTEKNETHDN